MNKIGMIGIGMMGYVIATNKDTSNLRFSLANSLKNLSYYNEMAEEMKVDHTVAQAVKNTLAQACNDVDLQSLLPEIVSIIGRRS